MISARSPPFQSPLPNVPAHPRSAIPRHAQVHIVIHGIDLNGDGGYDFENGPSPLTSDLPFEATVPAGCGELEFAGRKRLAKKIEWSILPIPHSMEADGGSQTSGTLFIKARGNRLFINMEVEGAASNLPHAQHLHGSLTAGDVNTCPTADAVTNALAHAEPSTATS